MWSSPKLYQKIYKKHIAFYDIICYNFRNVTKEKESTFMADNRKEETNDIERVAAPFHYVVANNRSHWSGKLIINQKLEPINPIQCGKQICPPRYSYTSESRDFWILHFVISGKGTLINKNGKQNVSENEIFVIRPLEKVTYTADADEPWQYIWIGFTSKNHVPQILEKSDVIYTPYLKEQFNRAYNSEHFENVDTYGAYEHYLCGIIWEIFGLLIQNSKKDTSAANNYIKPAMTIMELYYFDTKLTVTEIASRLRISQEHFSRIFKEETGSSPKKYLNGIRMQKAVEFLTQSDDTVTQIAKKVGFPDTFAFSRAFRNYYGCSPTEYAKNYKH